MHRKELDVPSRSHQPLKPLCVYSVGPKIVNPPGPACVWDRAGGGKQLGKQGLLSVLVSAVAVLINQPLGNSCEKTEAGSFPSIPKYLNYLSTPSSPSWACCGGALHSSPLLFLQVCPCWSPPSSPLPAWICAALWAELALLLFGGELVCRRQGWRNTAACSMPSPGASATCVTSAAVWRKSVCQVLAEPPGDTARCCELQGARQSPPLPWPEAQTPHCS